MELGPETRQIGPISGYISTHQLHASFTCFIHILHPTCDADNKAYQKIMKLIKIFLWGRAVRPPGKWGNVTLIHPISYKTQFFINEVLQCLVDKYQITYQNIRSEGMVRPHLVESSYCKKCWGHWKVHQFYTIFNSKNVFSSCCYIK